MSPWTSPRAYIIRMTAAQQRELHIAEQAKAQAMWNRYQSEMFRRHAR